jgi:hypothetical protein
MCDCGLKSVVFLRSVGSIWAKRVSVIRKIVTFVTQIHGQRLLLFLSVDRQVIS